MTRPAGAKLTPEVHERFASGQAVLPALVQTQADNEIGWAPLG
jgi:hypothetical protein